jgi:Tol biopolymer transport system component
MSVVPCTRQVRGRWLVALGIAIALGGCLAPAQAFAAAGAITRASVDSAGVQANDASMYPAVSADGRYVAFYSWASNLVPGDTNGKSDVFVHDRLTGTTTRVSVDSTGTQANDASLFPSISADGRYVAFVSSASNLAADATGFGQGVFVHDCVTGVTTLESVDSSGAPANDWSNIPSLSADGRFVAFASWATNLVPGDTNQSPDVFVHDRVTGATTRESVDSSGLQGTGWSAPTGNVAISGNGRFVVFDSDAANLVPGDTNSHGHPLDGMDVFVRDRLVGTTMRASVNSSETEANTRSLFASVSDDGRYVVFLSEASNLVPGDTNATQDVFVRDCLTGTTTRANVDSSGAQSGSAYYPSISGDGRYVTFSSSSPLVPGDTNGEPDVFLRDQVTGLTTRVSVGPSGTQAARGGEGSSVSPDGRFVVFFSYSNDLVPAVPPSDPGSRFGCDVFLKDVTGNEAPTTVDDGGVLFTVRCDHALTVPAPGILANDCDLDSGTLTAVLESAPSHGAVVLSPDGSFAYSPDAGFYGSDAFTYRADDGLAWSDPATVTITVTPPLGVAGPVIRASVDSSGTQGDEASTYPSLSADGRYVAFHSWASNLVSGDTNGKVDVFVHDSVTGSTGRASVDSSGMQGNADSSGAAISADGRYIAFASNATNLVAGDTNGRMDVFVHDTVTGSTTRASVESSGAQGTGYSGCAAISADGRWVAFTSDAANLVAGDTNGRQDVFVHDNVTGSTTRVSVDSSGGQGNGDCSLTGVAAISGNGRFIAFESESSNLVPGDTNASIPPFRGNDVFVHDCVTGSTTRVSVDSSGTQGNDMSDSPSVSFDGRYVAFGSMASNLALGDTNGRYDIFVRDLVAGSTTRVTVDPATAVVPPSHSSRPSISPDGRYVSFVSASPDIVPGDTNGAYDVFLYDRVSGVTNRVNVDAVGAETPHGADSGSVSADGRYVAFYSWSPDLVPATPPSNPGPYVGCDIFVKDMTGNVAPVAVDDGGVLFTTSEGATLTVAGPGVLANDYDVESGTLTAVLDTPPAHGVMMLGANGSLTYTPDAGFYGADTFTYRADDGVAWSDPATVTITVTQVDHTPPTSTSNAGVVHFNNTSVTVSCTEELDGSGMAALYYRLDGGETVEWARPQPEWWVPSITPTMSAPGAHFSSGRALDNRACRGCHLLNPPPPITAGVAAPAVHGSAPCNSCHPVAGAPEIGPDAVAPFGHSDLKCSECHALSGACPGGSLSTALRVAGIGHHTLEFWGKDLAGNVETPHKFAAVDLVDDVSPTTSCNATATYSNSARILIWASDNMGGSGVAHTYYQIDDGAPAEGVIANVGTYGSHTLSYWSVDQAGNVETPHQTVHFDVRDTIAPVTISDSNVVYLDEAEISLVGMDNLGGSGVAHTYYKLDGGDPEEDDLVWVWECGFHTLEFWSVDLAGNAEPPVSVAFFIEDTIAPFTFSDAEESYVGTASITLDAFDYPGGLGVAGTFYQLDDAPFVDGSEVTTSTYGTHRLEYYSVDEAGNIESPHNIEFFDVTELTPPSTTSDAVSTYSDSATVHLSAADQGGSGVAFTYFRLDSGTRSTGATVTVAACGPHSLEFWSVDGAGNEETPHKTAAFTVSDTIAPITTSDVVASYSDAATIHLSATDRAGGSGVSHTYYRFDSGAQTEGAVVSVGALGPHAIEFWSVDGAGNAESPHKTASFVVADATAPTTTSDATGSYANAATIHLSASDNSGGSGVAHTFYRLDSGAQTEGVVVSVAGLGLHAIEFWSVDGAGNAESPHKSASFVVADAIGPATTSDVVGAYANAATIHLASTDNAGGSGIAHTYYRIDGGAPAEGAVVSVAVLGSHTLEFWSVDLAGNAETPHKGASFVVVDTIAPSTTCDSVASYVGTATIHLTAADSAGGSGVAHTYSRLDGAAQAEGVVVSTTAVGAHALQYWSVDAAGNAESAHTATFTVESAIKATSITIKTAATTTSIGKTVSLSGAVTPNAMIGVNVVVYVMKPGKTYWTYSSNRTVYSLNGSAAWLYKYYFKPGMARGTYKYKSAAPAPGFASSDGFASSTSPMTVAIRVR